METLQEYHSFLTKNGYKMTTHGFISGWLSDVDYDNGSKNVRLSVEETEEFGNYLKELPDGTEYEIDYNNYIVTGALIESCVCNKTDFLDNSKKGIILVKEPGEYYIHGLDLFEYCVLIDGAEHENKILQAHLKNLEFFKEKVIPLLKEADYEFEYSSIFDIKDDRQKDSSNFVLTYKHPNAGMESFFMETDCLTGEPIIEGGNIDPHSDILTQLREKIWKNTLKYSYLLPNHDPKDVKETWGLVTLIQDALDLHRLGYKNYEKVEIDLNKIPDKYLDLVKEYKAMCGLLKT